MIRFNILMTIYDLLYLGHFFASLKPAFRGQWKSGFINAKQSSKPMPHAKKPMLFMLLLTVYHYTLALS